MGSYLRPIVLDDALAELRAGPRTILAGGTDIYPARVGRSIDDDVLDVSALRDHRAISMDDGCVRIPALATWTDVIRADLPPRFDGLKAAARAIGGVQIQNRATLVGNVCNASPAADGVPNLIALDAVMELRSTSGRRALPVSEFVVGNRRTVLRDDELATAILVPPSLGGGAVSGQPGSGEPGETGGTESRSRSSFLKLGSRAYLVISIAMVAVVIDVGADGRIVAARVVVGACSEVARRIPRVEARLVGRTPTAEIVDEIDAADLAGELAPIDDVRGTAAYRLEAAHVLVRRAVAEVLA